MKSTKTQEILNYVNENATENNNGLKVFFFPEKKQLFVKDFGYIVGVADAREDMENSECPLTTDLDAFMLIVYQGEDYDQEYVRLSHLLGGSYHGSSFPIWKTVMDIYDMLFKNENITYALTYCYEGIEDMIAYGTTIAVSKDIEKLRKKMEECIAEDCVCPEDEDEQYSTDQNFEVYDKFQDIAHLSHRVYRNLCATYKITTVEVL